MSGRKLLGTIIIAAGMAGRAVADSPPQPTEPDWGKLRPELEAAVRSRLVDPDSAKIVWANGFTWTSIQPFYGKRVQGWTTCGTVNSRNRMGGYVGAVTFVIVFSDTVQAVEIDGRSGFWAERCAKVSLPEVPPPLASEANAAAANSHSSLADEISKLAALRDRGVITQSEFESQKVKLLNSD